MPSASVRSLAADLRIVELAELAVLQIADERLVREQTEARELPLVGPRLGHRVDEPAAEVRVTDVERRHEHLELLDGLERDRLRVPLSARGAALADPEHVVVHGAVDLDVVEPVPLSGDGRSLLERVRVGRLAPAEDGVRLNGDRDLFHLDGRLFQLEVDGLGAAQRDHDLGLRRRPVADELDADRERSARVQLRNDVAAVRIGGGTDREVGAGVDDRDLGPLQRTPVGVRHGAPDLGGDDLGRYRPGGRGQQGEERHCEHAQDSLHSSLIRVVVVVWGRSRSGNLARPSAG